MFFQYPPLFVVPLLSSIILLASSIDHVVATDKFTPTTQRKLSQNLYWANVGQIIEGDNKDDTFGATVAMSSDGTTIAAGAIWNNLKGQVKVFRLSPASIDNNNNNNSDSDDQLWVQLGDNISGQMYYDFGGYSVALSNDGNIVAVGFTGGDATDKSDSGITRIFQLDNSSGKQLWFQLGTDIDGENESDNSGRSISLSADGMTVAIAARKNKGDNGVGSGHVRIFKFGTTDSPDDWFQVGEDIDGEEAYDSCVSLSSNGQRVAIGAEFHDADGSDSNDLAFENTGHVRTYEFQNDEWTTLGQDVDGDSSDDNFGKRVTISKDGNTLAASSNDYIKIFSFDETLFQWMPKGQTFDEFEDVEDGKNVIDIDLSEDGNIIIIGLPSADGNAGRTIAYKFDDETQTWYQTGDILNGEDDNFFGYSTSMSKDGTRIVVGCPSFKYSSGFIQVFELTKTTSQPSSYPSTSPSLLPSSSVIPSSYPSIVPTFEPSASFQTRGLSSSMTKSTVIATWIVTLTGCVTFLMT
jgi:hypothetical protein